MPFHRIYLADHYYCREFDPHCVSTPNLSRLIVVTTFFFVLVGQIYLLWQSSLLEGTFCSSLFYCGMLMTRNLVKLFGNESPGRNGFMPFLEVFVLNEQPQVKLDHGSRGSSSFFFFLDFLQ